MNHSTKDYLFVAWSDMRFMMSLLNFSKSTIHPLPAPPVSESFNSPTVIDIAISLLSLNTFI